MLYTTQQVRDWIALNTLLIPTFASKFCLYLPIGSLKKETTAPPRKRSPRESFDVTRCEIDNKYVFKPISKDLWESTVQYWFPPYRRDLLKLTVMFGCNLGAFTTASNGETRIVGWVSYLYHGGVGAACVPQDQRGHGLGTVLTERMHRFVKVSGFLPFTFTDKIDGDFHKHIGIELVDNYSLHVMGFSERLIGNKTTNVVLKSSL